MAGTTDSSSSSSNPRSWSSLPDDNLADVYLRLSSAHDRTRFASVCTSWRAVLWWHPAPVVPMLLPWTEERKRDRRSRAHDLDSGRALRVPLPWFARGKRLVGSYSGGWIAAVSNFHQLMIVNLFSGAQVSLSAKQRFRSRRAEARSYPCTGTEKVIFSDSPDSSGCILAAITGRFKLAVCRVGSPDNGWSPLNSGRTSQGCKTDLDEKLMDIAFCKGKLYGLARHSLEVFNFDIGVNTEGDLVVTSTPFLSIGGPSVFRSLYKSVVAYHDRYIFDLHGKLAMALEANSVLDDREARFFVVFEMDATPWGYMWTEVTTLGEHALFLGQTYSKAVRVGAKGRCGGVQKNHIYYSKQHRSKPSNHVLTSLDLGRFDVYFLENEAMHRWGNQPVHRSGNKLCIKQKSKVCITGETRLCIARKNMLCITEKSK